MKVSRASGYALHALMYMVRHSTQLPATTATIAKAEGMPAAYLSKIFQRLVRAGLVRSVRGQRRGYVFNREPDDISLLELFEVVEGGPLFADCFLRHCECGGTPENCCIYAQWTRTTKRMSGLLAETSVATAAWNHPEHRLDTLPDAAVHEGKPPGRCQ